MQDQSTPLTRKEIRHRSYLRSKGINVPKAKTGYAATPIAERTCEQCGKPFAPKTHSDPARFCSRLCAYAWRKANPSGKPKESRPDRLELTPADIDRFFSKVDMSGGVVNCWPWTGGLFPNGYGQFKLRGIGPIQAHRVAWALAHDGALPSGLLILHHCDNRRCVNEFHLFDGSHKDNMTDMATKGRSASGVRHGSRTHPERVPRGDRSGRKLHPEEWPVGEAHPNAVLTDAQAETIRIRCLAGEGVIALANEFGVSRQHINRIVHRKGRFALE